MGEPAEKVESNIVDEFSKEISDEAEEIHGNIVDEFTKETSAEEVMKDKTGQTKEYVDEPDEEIENNNIEDREFMKESSIEQETETYLHTEDIFDKIKYHNSELSLLVEAIEREKNEDKNFISNQKIYIEKLEKDVQKFRDEADSLRVNFDRMKDKLSRAEKKLEIVKRELLD